MLHAKILGFIFLAMAEFQATYYVMVCEGVCVRSRVLWKIIFADMETSISSASLW